jgi:1-aminocyclopropane-1-carboxylate deaminase/D-cysteine desulfhydrase-like pyridoxal-dependent ACC family enzyme
VPPILQSIQAPGSPNQLHIDVLRLDLVHPVISGNKWYKLQGHWPDVLRSSGTIITFGGAWSNHLLATACAAGQAGLRSVGIVRGDEPPQLSATLVSAREYGMQLEFISRSQYAGARDPRFLAQLANRYPGAYIIPEGGAGIPGIRGATDILGTVDTSLYTHILCAVGTGTMLLGLALAARPGQTVIGVPVLKGVDPLTDSDASLLTPEQTARTLLLTGYHFGGYARHPQRLLDFINELYRQTGIPSDIVYTGKLFYAVMDSAEKNIFPESSRLLVIHSGGLQGNRSLPPGALLF